jgi:hypothetical protein
VAELDGCARYVVTRGPQQIKIEVEVFRKSFVGCKLVTSLRTLGPVPVHRFSTSWLLGRNNHAGGKLIMHSGKEIDRSAHCLSLLSSEVGPVR